MSPAKDQELPRSIRSATPHGAASRRMTFDGAALSPLCITYSDAAAIEGSSSKSMRSIRNRRRVQWIALSIGLHVNIVKITAPAKLWKCRRLIACVSNVPASNPNNPWRQHSVWPSRRKYSRRASPIALMLKSRLFQSVHSPFNTSS